MKLLTKTAKLSLCVSLILVISQVSTVRGEKADGYIYSKSLTVDYFIIENAHDDLIYTCVYEDFIYILNDTKLQKISLETGVVVDEIEWVLLNSVNELMRKGSRIYIEATIDAAVTTICIDIETFTEIAQIIRTFSNGLQNVEYYDCNGHDVWAWAHAGSDPQGQGTIHENIFRGAYDTPSVDYEWSFISGHIYMGTIYTGDVIVRHYRYNATSTLTNYTEWDVGNIIDHASYYWYAGIYFNHTSNVWTAQSGASKLRDLGAGSQLYPKDDYQNLQWEFIDSEMSAVWGEYGVRDNPIVSASPNTYFVNNKGEVWLDTEDRSGYYWWYHNYDGQAVFRSVRFDKSTGYHSPETVDIQNKTNLDESTWGQMALARLDDKNGVIRSWLGYVNATGQFPKAEYIIEVSGVETLEAGTVEFQYDNLTASMVFMARKNIVSLFTIGSDEDNIYVCRNLIDRNLLASGGYITPTLRFDEAALYESDGVTLKTDGWLFMGEVYVLKAEVSNCSTFYLELNDGVNNIRFNYVNATKHLEIEAPDLVVGLVQGKVTTLNATADEYELAWKFILNRNILDVPIGQNITYYGYNSIEDTDISGTAITGLKIYNLGGHVTYDFQGDAGRRIGGDALEIEHTNSTGSGAYVDVMFRRMQHVHLAFSLDVEDNDCFDVDENSGVVQFGFKYWDGSEWDTLYYAEMSIVNGAVDPVAGDGKAFIIPYVSWNSRQSNGVMTTIKSDTLSGYPECADDVNSQLTSSKFYLDLWFNTMNSSTTIGGRISTKYFGMDETATWFFWSNWKPVMVNMTESMFFDDLRDESGDILQISEIELVKFYIRVLKTGAGAGSCDSHTWGITDPEFSKTLAADRMQAVNTPDGIDTLVLDMPSSGFLQPIAKAISGIGNVIWQGGLNFIKILISSMDTITEWMGFPAGTFSQITNYVMSIPDFMISLFGYFSDILVNMGTQITNLFSIIAVGIPQMIYGSGVLVSTLISYMTQIVSLFTGGWSGVSNFWSSLSLGQWIELFVIAVLPFMWLARITDAKDSFKTAREDIGWLFSMLFSIVKLGTWLIQTIGSIIQAIRNILPI